VLRKLADASATEEAAAIENVRINSNYLTPKVGAMSADAWSDRFRPYPARAFAPGQGNSLSTRSRGVARQGRLKFEDLMAEP
jgi:hypothetical protein